MSQVPRLSLVHHLCDPWYIKCTEALNRIVNAAGLTLMGLQECQDSQYSPYGIDSKLPNSVLPSSG